MKKIEMNKAGEKETETQTQRETDVMRSGEHDREDDRGDSGLGAQIERSTNRETESKQTSKSERGRA